MPETFAEVLAMPELWFLCLGAVLAGIVRGFSGFGTAMVYLPVAAQVLGPFEALTTMIIMDVTTPLMHVPRALKDGHPKDVLRLGAGAIIAVPFGVLILSLVEPVAFRWAVSIIALTLLVLLIAGVRYRGTLSKPMIYGTGGLGGFLAGSVGLPGPPVIMLYMASSLPAQTVRANNMLFLLVADFIMLTVLALNGLLVKSALVLGLLLILPYSLGNWLGAALFRPEAEKFYRLVAYAIIAGSAILGLPLWD